MKLLAILLAFLLLVIHSAQACVNVLPIKAGTAAPCDGWLVKDSQMQDFAKTADKLSIEQKINETNKQLLTLSAAEIEFYRNRSQSQSKELERAETRRFLATAGAFALGVVLTGIAAKAAIEAAR